MTTPSAPVVPDAVVPGAVVPDLPWSLAQGQPEAVAQLQRAVEQTSSLAHAWLITGPPGSGRSTLATAFAAALIADPAEEATARENTLRQVLSGTHPDVTILRTEQVIIRIDEARRLVERAYFSPSLGRYRVIVVEDADRMAERTSNVLLKALEEPPERTVWILCAPSDADLLPTIRSRVRVLRLREPEVADVARLIASRTGVSEARAEQAARLAQRHIGMAQRLATDADAMNRREQALDAALRVRGVGDAIEVAARIVQVATEDAKAITAERDEAERAGLRNTLGLAEGASVPASARSQLSALEEAQKRRATRSLRDGIDRALTDMQSLYRDVLMLQLVGDRDLINQEREGDLRALADGWTSQRTLEVLDHLASLRRDLEQNVAPTLALESLLITVAHGRTP